MGLSFDLTENTVYRKPLFWTCKQSLLPTPPSLRHPQTQKSSMPLSRPALRKPHGNIRNRMASFCKNSNSLKQTPLWVVVHSQSVGLFYKNSLTPNTRMRFPTFASLLKGSQIAFLSKRLSHSKLPRCLTTLGQSHLNTNELSLFCHSINID